MTVIACAGLGGPEVLREQTRPVPRPGPGEVLIKVAAAGLNGADLVQRQGKYNMPPGVPDYPGLEVSGAIADLGHGVTMWAPGQEVCALVSGGGYGQYCIAAASQCLPIPRGLSLIEAAALPEVVLTVWLNVFELGGLRPQDTLLIHGGSSGIGTMAIQMARALGARVIVTAGSPAKCNACEELGAARAINYRVEDFAAVIDRENAGRGVDVILDMVGGNYLPRDLQILAPRGRLVMIAFKLGSKVELDCVLIQQKQLTVTGSRLRPQSIDEKGRLISAVRNSVWPLIESGAVRPIIDSTFPLSEARRAHERMESGEHIGKILLTL
jgi:NADPH2:quinone reductase